MFKINYKVNLEVPFDVSGAFSYILTVQDFFMTVEQTA